MVLKCTMQRTYFVRSKGNTLKNRRNMFELICDLDRAPRSITPTACRMLAAPLRVVASAAAGVAPGRRVRVTAPVAVFHVPKSKGAATQLQGLTGVVTALADVHTDGTLLSCTMPLKARAAATHCARSQPRRSQVELSVAAADGSPVKFSTHLTLDEVELL